MRVQAAVRVRLLVRASAGDSPGVHVVVVVVIVVMVAFVAVAEVLWMSVGHFDQPHLLTPLQLGQFVWGAVAHLLLCSPLVWIRHHGAGDDVFEARLGLRASLFGDMNESIRAGVLDGRRLVLTGKFWLSDTYAFSAVDCAGWKDGGNDGSQTLSGPGGDYWFWVWIGDAHPSCCLTPEFIRLGFSFSLGLRKNEKSAP